MFHFDEKRAIINVSCAAAAWSKNIHTRQNYERRIYDRTGREESRGETIFGLTDETYSLVCHLPKDMDRKEQMRYSLLVTVFDHCYWVTGSVIGSLIPFSAKGIDFALTALFITIFTDQWLTTKNHFSAIAGVLASVACVLLFGSANFLIPAMIAISVILITGKKFALKEEKSK